ERLVEVRLLETLHPMLAREVAMHPGDVEFVGIAEQVDLMALPQVEQHLEPMRRHADEHAVPRLDHVDRLHIASGLAEDLVNEEVRLDETAFILEDRLLDRVEVVRVAQEGDEVVPRARDVDVDEDVAEVEEEGG